MTFKANRVRVQDLSGWHDENYIGNSVANPQQFSQTNRPVTLTVSNDNAYTSAPAQDPPEEQEMSKRNSSLATLVLIFIACAGWAGDKPHPPKLTAQQSGTTNRLVAISPVNSKVAWASGAGGTFTRTTDGGKTWKSGVVSGAETLEFRDVQAFSDKVAYLLSIGPGTDSRIYKTLNGGKTWTLQFQNQNLNAFYDCFAFWNPWRGLTTSDSVEGRFPVIRTKDGKTWQDIGDNLPPAQPGEASFASSGTCVATQGRRRAWIATGGAEKARILATTDGGNTWNAYETPVVQGTPSSGVFTVSFRDAWHGVIGAGELADPTKFYDNFARSQDGGKTWTLATRSPFTGAIYGLSYAGGRDDDSHDWWRNDDDDRGDSRKFTRTVVITGPSGAAWSPDEGTTWNLLSGVANYWAVAFANPRSGWFVGTEGRILKISFQGHN
jgi:photosystem II stability/assembly factor-like uncharacterized protein